MPICQHLRDLAPSAFPPPRTPGECEECAKTGARWVELRECRRCGHVGCCDSSPGHHARRHFEETRHPVVRSAMRDASWAWCYVDEEKADLLPGGTVAAARRV